MRLNTANKPTKFTHEGAPARHIDPVAHLRRLCMSSLLWERQFYVDGQEIAEGIRQAAASLPVQTVADIAVEARQRQNLRHLPLYLMALLSSREALGPGAKEGLHLRIAEVIERADELAEIITIWCEVNGISPKDIKRLPAQLKKGIAAAFGKFDAYQLTKYDRANAITLLDVARMVHPQHTDAIGGLVKGTLSAPDTWEVALSSGSDKRETWERLIREGRLGYLALLRNLRNMDDAGVDKALAKDAIRERKGARRVLPFRYVAAARHAPWAASALNDALVASVGEMPPFDGVTLILVDVSGSMRDRLSSNSDMNRMDAAAALAAVWPGESRVFSFSHGVVECPAYRGLPMIDGVINSQQHGGTYLGAAVSEMNKLPHDRLVVITDEQSHDRVPEPVRSPAYMINVASYKNGVGYGRWTHIDGWSENVLRFMHEMEGRA